MAFDLNALETWESGYRDRLLDDPANFDARLDLAWCLFLQAVCCSAREEMLLMGGGSLTPAGVGGERGQKSANDMFIAGLREAFKVCQLSATPSHHAEVARLEFLVGLVGKEEAIEQAHHQVGALLGRLAHDMPAEAPTASLVHPGITLSRGQAAAGARSARRATRKQSAPPNRPTT